MSTLNTLSLLEVPVLEWEQGLTFLDPHADLWICNKASLECGYMRLGKVHHIWLQIFLYCSRLPQYTVPNGIYGDKFGTYPTRFNSFFSNLWFIIFFTRKPSHGGGEELPKQIRNVSSPYIGCEVKWMNPGIKYANVFPVPVCAMPIRSIPCSIIGHAWDWHKTANT